MCIDEEAVNIILTLRDTTSRHKGLEWEEIKGLIEINAPRKPLWYTLRQKETLFKWVDRIREDEKKKSHEQMSNPKIQSQVEQSFLGKLFKKK
jgi:hypothetical protein